MFRAAFLATGTVLVLAACGSAGSSDDAATSAATEEATVEPTIASTIAITVAAPETSQPSESSQAPETSQTPPSEPAVVPEETFVPAAMVGATTVDGEAFDAEALKGRPTVAWFWAPWCTVCRAEAPDVAAVVAEYSDRVNFVGVAGRGEAPEMREFVSDTGVEAFTHLDDSSGEIWLAYEIYAQPAFAFITADGRTETFTGALGAEDLTSIVEQLIAA